MEIEMKSEFELNGEQFPIATNFPALDERTLLWVSSGVYFGYPKRDIISFCQMCIGKREQTLTEVLSGTGYVPYDIFPDKNKLIEEINKNRYNKEPFNEKDTKANYSTLVEKARYDQNIIKTLLSKDEGFIKKVYEILIAF
jgi:hypothetical protein